MSIIVPVHNAERTLSKCINSIITQSYENIECILVENGSNDRSKELCTFYADKFKNIVLKSINLKNVSAARNVGVELASGNIIGFCDADDFLENDAIINVVNEYSKSPDLSIIVGGFFVGEIYNNKIRKAYRGLRDKKISAKEALRLIIINDSVMGSVWNKYYKVDALKNIKFDENLSFCEDMHFNARILTSISSKKEIKIISRPLYCYVENYDSVTHQQNLLYDENNDLKYIVALKRIANDCNIDKRSIEIIKMKIACLCIDHLMDMNLERTRRKKLIFELKKTYRFLIKNIYLNNFKLNARRMLYGIKILLCS